MAKVTNIDAIKTIAIAFLNVNIQPTSYPLIASHPFTSSWVVFSEKSNLIDLHEENNQKIWRESVQKHINNTKNVLGIFSLLNTPYILEFLKFTENYISNEDLSEILKTFWKHVEYINTDSSIRTSMIKKWFKRAHKDKLMSEKELEVYNNLPETVTIYRGVTSYNNKKKKAVSWTLDREVAEWFANRFDTNTGEVWEQNVNKDQILCYFEEEDEVIVEIK